MSSVVHVCACHSGIVHVSIGAVTIRLDGEAFQRVAAELARHANNLRALQRPWTPMLAALKAPAGGMES